MVRDVVGTTLGANPGSTDDPHRCRELAVARGPHGDVRRRIARFVTAGHPGDQVAENPEIDDLSRRRSRSDDQRGDDQDERDPDTRGTDDAIGAGMPLRTEHAIEGRQRASKGRVRLVVAQCSVTYSGRLGAYLAPGRRLIIFKADGSVAIHSDSKAYKPLNWMNPPCSINETSDGISVVNPKGESLTIDLHEVDLDTTLDLGVDPGLEKDGVEAELQALLAKRIAALRDDFELIRREYPTDIGPVDLLCTDSQGQTVVVEVKRVGEIAGVEQLLRYQERLDLDSRFAPTQGMLVAERIKPQARVFAESRGVDCVEVDLARLRGEVDDLTLFEL